MSDEPRTAKEDREDLAAGLEADRVVRESQVESERADRAEVLRSDRVELAQATEANRVVREVATEADRSDRAAGVELDRSDRAAVVESDRSDRADAVIVADQKLAAEVELTRAELAAILEADRKEMAAILEADRKRHNLRMEERLKERTKLVNRRFIVIFLAGALVFGLLAYRGQVNDENIQNNTNLIATTQYQGCLQRSLAATKYNASITQLIALSNQTPQNPPLTPEQQATRDQQIRDAFIRPVEDCGPPPQ